MNKVFKTTHALLVALLISAFGVIGHVSAMPVAEHGHTQYAATASASCASICIGVPANKKQEMPVLDDDEKEPQPPYYLQFKSAQTGWFAIKSIEARTIEQPGVIPKYRLCCTIRR